MSQPRVNLYGFPHKGLRNGLSQLSMLAGNTDYSDELALDKIRNLTDELVLLLDTHAEKEDQIVLPALEERAPGSTAENIEEHIELENEVEAFHDLLRSMSTDSSPTMGAGFYEAVNSFYAKYIIHMDMEEKDINPILWEHFTDDELMGIQGQILGSFSPEMMMKWFEYIIPALNPFERTIMLGGFKQNAPSEAFDTAINMLRNFMPSSELDQVVEDLSQPAGGS